MLFNKGLSYSTVNTARYAHALLDDIITEGKCAKSGTHHVITRFMKAASTTKNPFQK